MPELRKLWMGEQLGFNNASKATRSILAAHSYRASLIVGVQPIKAGPLLDDADGGTPQRFMFLPVGDPDAPEIAPGRTAALDDQGSAVGGSEDRAPRDPGHCPRRDGQTSAGDVARRGRGPTRWASDAGAVEDGRCADDPRRPHRRHRRGLAPRRVIERVSNRTRAGIEATVAERARAASRARAHEQPTGKRSSKTAPSNASGNEHETRYSDVWGRGGVVSRKSIRTTMRSELKSLLDAALADLISEGLVAEQSGGVRAHVGDSPVPPLKPDLNCDDAGGDTPVPPSPLPSLATWENEET